MGLTAFKNEPLTDFSTEPGLKAMRGALKEVEGSLGDSYQLRIGSKRIETREEMLSINPSAPDQVVGHVAKAGRDEADLALHTATETFEDWSRTPPEARARILLRAAAIMRRRKLELAAWEIYEAGKPWSEADADVAEAIDFLEYYAREMLRLKDGVEIPPTPGEENRYFYQPLGVGVIVPPWNFPLAILTGMTSAAIVAGNTVVLKPASSTPVMGAKFAEVMEEAGLPDGVLNFCPGSGSEIGDYLVADRRTRFISFTGSMQVGLHINELAAKTAAGQRWIKRVIAEMGGKDAIIVDSSADLDAAAEGIVASAYGFQGQKCSACSRAILHRDIYDTVLNKVADLTRELKVGAPTTPEVNLGPVIDAAAFKKISGYMQIGAQEGELACGGTGEQPEGGYFLQPTVFSGVKPEARIAQEEIFGPVLAVMRAAGFEEALRTANSTAYGLTGGVYSKDREHLERARSEFRAGNLYFNRKITGALVGAQPFGGFDMSGTDSKAGGPDYLPMHMQAKTVVERF